MSKMSLSRSRAFSLLCVVVAIVFALVNLLREAAWLMPLEMAHFDLTTSALASPELARDLVLVTVTESELAEWGWPLPDGKLAEIVNATSNAGAKIIGVDIYRDNPVAPGSEDLKKALSDSRVIAISKLGPNGALAISPPAAVVETGRFGFVDTPIDFDGVTRRSLLLVNTLDGVTLSFALKLAMAASNQTTLRPWEKDARTLIFGNTPVPSLIDDFGAKTPFRMPTTAIGYPP